MSASHTQTTVVTQTTNQVLQLVLRGRPGSVRQAFGRVQEQLEQAVQAEMTPEFMQDLEQEVAALGLEGEAARDVVVVVILKKIEELLQKIIAGHPPEVQQEADEALEEISQALSAQSAASPAAVPEASPSAASSSSARCHDVEVPPKGTESWWYRLFGQR